jgi:hypothetical protein
VAAPAQQFIIEDAVKNAVRGTTTLAFDAFGTFEAVEIT